MDTLILWCIRGSVLDFKKIEILPYLLFGALIWCLDRRFTPCISFTNGAFCLQNLHFIYKPCIWIYKLAFRLQLLLLVFQMRLFVLLLSGQRIRLFYYTRYRNSEQQIFASQYENIQLKFISQQGFPFTFSQPLLTKTGTEIYPLFGQTSVPVLPVRAGAYLSCRSRMDRYCMDRRGVQRGKAPSALGFQ